jgi:hypothetical protein
VAAFEVPLLANEFGMLVADPASVALLYAGNLQGVDVYLLP